MNYKKRIQIIWLCIILSTPLFAQVALKDNFFYIDGEKFFVKGIGYELSALPGEVPWEKTFNPEQLHFDIQRILDAGYNTIRTWAPFTAEELDVLQSYDIKIIMGIWIDPHADFSDHSFVFESNLLVLDILSYSRNYDNIIAYLIMNEPLPETIFEAGYSETSQLWTELIDIIHTYHPNRPVSISNTSNGTFIDSEIFDFSAYNVYIYNPVTVNYLHEYRDYISYLNQLNSTESPLIITEYGLSVSPTGPGNWGYGGNSLVEQEEGILNMYKSLVDGGASGSCVFNYSDGWWKSGNEFVHNDEAEEWFGLVKYNSLDDNVGELRPVWEAVKKFQSAIITQPKSSEIYGNRIPIEIFLNDTIDHFEILLDEIIIYQNQIINSYLSDTFVISSSEMKDANLIFKFYDKENRLVKSEEKNILISNIELILPSIDISTNDDYWQTGVVNVNYIINKSSSFTIDTMLNYVYYPHQGFDYGQKFEITMPEEINIDFNSQHAINAEVDVFTIGAAFNINFNKFKKRIVNQLTFSRIDISTSIIDNKESNFKVYPNPTSDFIKVSPNSSTTKSGFSYTIYNNLGSIIKHSSTLWNQSISISDLKSGTYHIKINYGHKNISEYKKIIVLRNN